MLPCPARAERGSILHQRPLLVLQNGHAVVACAFPVEQDRGFEGGVHRRLLLVVPATCCSHRLHRFCCDQAQVWLFAPVAPGNFSGTRCQHHVETALSSGPLLNFVQDHSGPLHGRSYNPCLHRGVGAGRHNPTRQSQRTHSTQWAGTSPRVTHNGLSGSTQRAGTSPRVNHNGLNRSTQRAGTSPRVNHNGVTRSTQWAGTSPRFSHNGLTRSTQWASTSPRVNHNRFHEPWKHGGQAQAHESLTTDSVVAQGVHTRRQYGKRMGRQTPTNQSLQQILRTQKAYVGDYIALPTGPCSRVTTWAIFDRPRTRVVGAWLAHSRRQKSHNPESHRAGKRSRVGF